MFMSVTGFIRYPLHDTTRARNDVVSTVLHIPVEHWGMRVKEVKEVKEGTTDALRSGDIGRC